MRAGKSKILTWFCRKFTRDCWCWATFLLSSFLLFLLFLSSTFYLFLVLLFLFFGFFSFLCFFPPFLPWFSLCFYPLCFLFFPLNSPPIPVPLESSVFIGDVPGSPSSHGFSLDKHGWEGGIGFFCWDLDTWGLILISPG